MAVKKPDLTLVQPDANIPRPPRKLREHGSKLWHQILTEYDIDDAGGLELLALAAEAVDRIANLSEEIARDGEVVRARNGGVKAHPALQYEIANRQFVSRTLTKLGVCLEPLKAQGRPSGSYDWSGDAD
jgi:hypothetical protein